MFKSIKKLFRLIRKNTATELESVLSSSMQQEKGLMIHKEAMTKYSNCRLYLFIELATAHVMGMD